MVTTLAIEPRHFGTSGLKVSALGLGAGAIGDANLPEEHVAHLLNAVLDAGMTLIDTARGYGLSEERIGRHLSHRRSEYVLSTKVGYGIPGYHDWTYECILAGVHHALKLMKTDYLDIVYLHSCTKEAMQQGGVIDGLEEMKRQGKIRVIGYAGENEHLEYALGSHRIGSIMASVNVCDQRIIDHQLPRAKEQGMGVIAKRPIANAPWRFPEQPYGQYAEEYWLRWKAMGLDFVMDWQEIAIRFSAFTYGVDSCIIGSTNLEHIYQNITLVNKGVLPSDILNPLREAFRQHDDYWFGQL